MTKQLRLLTMAAMMLLAACDEGSDTVAPGVTGSVAGTVTIDGAGAAGVVVTLSSGKTATTSATGTYTIADVAAGAYTVTISGAPADVAFPSTTQAAVVATAGQVVTVNFAGSRIRTSAIFGSVTSGAAGLAGVTVTLTGPETKTATTDANGQFSAAALRAGTYTVAISGTPNTVTCATTSQSIVVAAGESKVAAFACTANSTARISGILFVDENNKNDVFDGALLEDGLAAANVLITLEGPTIGTLRTAQTDATGAFTFTLLAAGTYSVKIDNADPDIPAGYVYGGTSPIAPPVTLAAGASGTVNFPFDITTETIRAFAFLGNDTRTLPVGGPVRNVILDLYPTESDATGLTNRIGKDTTDVNGEVQFSFLRTADTSPGGAAQDQVVFAQISNDVNAVPAGLTVNGETRIEIKYNPKLRTDMAKDTFDMLNGSSVLKVDVFGISGTALSGWNAELYTDTLPGALGQPIQTVASSAAAGKVGRVEFAAVVAAPPVNYFVKLAATQPVATVGTHAFTTTRTAERATVAGSYLRFTHNGLTNTADTVDVGDVRVTFSDSDVFVQVYNERDDTLRRTTLDGTLNVGNMMVGMRYSTAANPPVVVNVAEQVALAGGNTFLNIPTGRAPYIIWSRSTVGTQVQLEEDTLFNVGSAGGPGDMSGGVATANVCPLSTSQLPANCGTFAYKHQDGTINGSVMSSAAITAAQPAQGMRVRIRTNPRTIQPRPTDTTVAVAAGGTFSVTGIREGQYIVSILRDSVTTAGDSVWASLANASTANADVEGSAAVFAVPGFTVVRMDTRIEGVVVNDRDADLNTVDPGEALAGVTVQLYRDGSGAITLSADSLVGTTTTNANGAYTFTKLREGTYAVKVTGVAGSTTLRKFGALGAVVDTAIVHTTALPSAGAAANVDNNARVGNQAPNPLPRWDYANSTQLNNTPSHFTFLYSTNTVRGRVSTAVGDTSIVAMTMTLSRCLVSPSQPSPPAGVALPGCTSYFPGFTPQNVNTDAGGIFTFPNLQEGVYEVKSNPATAGRVSTTPTAGAMVAGNPMLFTLLGNNDVETGNFVTP